MSNKFDHLPNGYQETIEKGLNALRVFGRVSRGIGTREEQLKKLKEELTNADAIVIGAGAGLSTSAGLTYSGERFDRYFFDFKQRFGINDIYSGGFYPFPDSETRWAWWARHIYFNRYSDPPKPVYRELLELVNDKNYFVITTNVDHQFQRAGFDKTRLFYTQGDYGLFQSVNRNLQKTYDNEEWVYRAMEAQGFVKDENGVFQVPDDRNIKMQIPTELIPKCPDDGSDVDIYSGGFYPFPDSETRWAWWARHIYFNRYSDPPKPVYRELLELVNDKNYFVITTNVDHQFQRAGFDKTRLFYTQGDYGLFQSVNRNLQKTYDNEEWVYRAMEAQGFVKDENGVFQVPDDRNIKMQIPTELIPKCPDDGSDVVMNLRSDDSFVEDEGWHRASAAYADFLKKHQNDRVLYLELGVGSNTPVIVKYPFWQMTLENDKATYACLNYSEAYCPEEIAVQSVCVEGDIGNTFDEMDADIDQKTTNHR